MTGAEAWRLYDRLVREYVSSVPPRERHKYVPDLLGRYESLLRETLGEVAWEEFRDARYEAGYHR